VDGRRATRIAYKYAELSPPPPYPSGSTDSSRNLAVLFWHIEHGANLTAAPARKPVEVVIFAGTPAERRFKLPGLLSPERIKEWIREVEAARGGKESEEQ
jgi:hypothetical protein